MASLKIAVIGAGSFVFGSSLLDEALRVHRLGDVALALVDAAVCLDATVLDEDAGIRAIDACLAAHHDILPAHE